MWHKWIASLAFLGLVSCAGALPSAPSKMLHKSVQLQFVGPDDQPVTVPASGAEATVLEFWSPTCEPCKTRVPDIVGKAADLRTKGADLVLVAVLSGDESTHDAEVALEAWGVRGQRSLTDHGDTLQTQLGVNALPATAILKGSELVWIAPAAATASDVVDAVP